MIAKSNIRFLVNARQFVKRSEIQVIAKTTGAMNLHNFKWPRDQTYKELLLIVRVKKTEYRNHSR